MRHHTGRSVRVSSTIFVPSRLSSSGSRSGNASTKHARSIALVVVVHIRTLSSSSPSNAGRASISSSGRHTAPIPLCTRTQWQSTAMCVTGLRGVAVASASRRRRTSGKGPCACDLRKLTEKRTVRSRLSAARLIVPDEAAEQRPG